MTSTATSAPPPVASRFIVLHCQLLIRGPRQHQLTFEGQQLLGYARRLLDLHTEALAAFHGQEVTGRIWLCVSADYAANYLTPRLTRFAPRDLKSIGRENMVYCRCVF